jgi:sugar lactone lactonase YvrE
VLLERLWGYFQQIQVDPVTGQAAGPVTPILTGLNSPEDFSIISDGSVYLSLISAGTVRKVTPDGKKSTVASVTECSSNAFGRSDADKNSLYIATSSGGVSSVSIS